MKKEYTKPQMEVVEIQTAQMLCASGPVTGVDGNGDWNWGGTIGTTSGNDKSAQRDSPPVHFF